MAVITGLSEPGDGCLAQSGQMIKGGQEAPAPTVVEKGECLAGQVVPPVAQIAAKKVRAGPVCRCLAVFDMTANSIFVSADSWKMAGRT